MEKASSYVGANNAYIRAANWYGARGTGSWCEEKIKHPVIFLNKTILYLGWITFNCERRDPHFQNTIVLYYYFYYCCCCFFVVVVFTVHYK